MRHRAWFIAPLLFCWSISPVLAAPPTDLGLVPSVALAEDAASLALNPAGLGLSTPGSLMLNRQGWPEGITRLMLQAGGVGMGFTQDSRGAAASQDLAFATNATLWDSAHLGLTYHLRSDGRPWVYDVGLLTRPFNYLSLGCVIRDALTPAQRDYQIGAAFRPFGPRFTLSVDLPFTESTVTDVSHLQPFGGLEVEILDGLKLRAQGTVNGEFRLGLAMNTPQMTAGLMSTAAQTGAFVRSSVVREPSILASKGSMVAMLDLKEALSARGPTFNLLGAGADVPRHFHAIQTLAEARRDPQVGAMIVKLGPLDIAWATLEELRSAFKSFRQSGKPLWVYFEDADFQTYYLASAADRLLENPMGTVELTGISQTLIYFKGLLDNLGVESQFIAMGRYKTAMEPFERKEPSDAQREQSQALTDDQANRVIQAISEARRLSPAQVKALIDRGYFDAASAQQANLVDELAQRDEVPKRLEQVLGRSLHMVKADALRYAMREWAPPRIAILNVRGEIVEGRSGNDLLQGGMAGAETILAAVRTIREDSSIKAVVLRIDSPGGSAMASEVMRRDLVLLAKAKPLVVSMGDVAASGGYWIAMIPDVPVFADAGTITGSIGVLMGKFNISGLLAKWGITHTTLKNGAHADAGSNLRGYTPEEENQLRSLGESYYDRFVHLVATHRHLSVGRVRELASGRVYSGAMALDLGLVDKLGGLEDALAEARHRVGLDSQRVRFAFFPSVNPFGPFLEESEGEIRLAAPLSLRAELSLTSERLQRWGRTGVWLLPSWMQE